ncbi:MAG: CpsB/CapC family capsule biosynthesis tyrosine phosphatase, partial [Thermodesulfobacteriota bacterium]|nr:CpsB/CapC family capsule biosynthesis tyrosine phosphatase [Thermodesulfobacteriota bacterium]
SKIRELNILLSRESGFKYSDSQLATHDLKILPGADIHIHPEIPQLIEEEKILLIGGKYILLEFPDYFLFQGFKEFIIKLKSMGITTIISHPERNNMIQKNKEILYNLIKEGVLSQVTAMSITGEFGGEIQKFTETLLKSGLVHIIATDCHSTEKRPPILSKAIEVASKIIGEDRVIMMVEKIPGAVIEGRKMGKIELEF